MKKTLSLLMVVVLILSTSIVFADEIAPPNWDISGTWDLNYNGSYSREFRDLVQDEDGNVTGEFWWLNSGEWDEGGPLVGHVSGDEVILNYERGSYTGVFAGTIGWEGMGGLFTDNKSNEIEWFTVDGEPDLLWDARVSGGGQMMADSGKETKNGKPIFYKISFGGGSYVSNGDLYFDGLEVTLHNISNEDVVGGKFVGEEVFHMDFGFSEGVANYKVRGTFNGETGYWMWIRVQDSGEPNFDADNLRFELREGKGNINDLKVYDSLEDFPGESNLNGTARNSLERGNIQVDNGGYREVK